MRLYKGCYTQRDSGGVWTTPEMSGQGSHYGSHHGYWESKGMYEDTKSSKTTNEDRHSLLIYYSLILAVKTAEKKWE